MSEHFQHHLAVIEPNVAIGARTRIWAFVHVLSGVVIGEDCNLCDHTFVESAVRIGNRVTIKCGVSLWDGVIVEDDVFIGPNAVFTNDKRPRSRKHPDQFPTITLKEGASLGANCTILPGITVGRWAMVGAGAVVTHDVPDHGLVVGTPARLVGWVCQCGEKLSFRAARQLVCGCGRRYLQAGEDRISECESFAPKFSEPAVVSQKSPIDQQQLGLPRVPPGVVVSEKNLK